METYIIRHAGSVFGRKGEDPPVSPEGEKEMNRMLDVAVESFGFKPTLIVTSPILRAKQTAEIVKKKARAKVVVDRCIRPEAKPEEVLEFLDTLKKDDRVVLVTHMPVVFELLYSLIGGRGDVELLNGSIASIHFEKRAAAGKGKLMWLLQPRG